MELVHELTYQATLEPPLDVGGAVVDHHLGADVEPAVAVGSGPAGGRKPRATM